jgi:hypothetical protein
MRYKCSKTSRFYMILSSCDGDRSMGGCAGSAATSVVFEAGQSGVLVFLRIASNRFGSVKVINKVVNGS